MIIDTHYHMMHRLGKGTARVVVQWTFETAKKIGMDIDFEQLATRAQDEFASPDGGHLLKVMDAAGIDITMFCAMDNSSIKAATLEVAKEINEQTGAIARRHPDRFIGLAGVDPRRPEAPELLRRCFDEYGLKGLKLHPDLGYYPNSEEAYKLYEIVQEAGGIVLIHTGPIIPPGKGGTYAHPLLLDPLAADFPDLKVIAAHMGQYWWRDWAGLASLQPNLYGDLAEWQVMAKRTFPLFCRELREVIDKVGCEKILFGSDGPVFEPVIPVADWIEILKSLPGMAPKGIVFTKEEMDAILGGNAERMLDGIV
ncbi:MAG: amidohydrolase family protein [Syntrophales bacterium]|jgi:predicted TIM-barrel fold metal-dependent hydrolase|nr:amidohydrolase family protein [Syntrophales bacterium]MDY0043311.1 amidohydrolase family protein [Syntrophales bacterium]